MNMVPIFLFEKQFTVGVQKPTAQLFVQLCCSGVTPPETLERIRPRHLEMERECR